jgi:hypothetical protein
VAVDGDKMGDLITGRRDSYELDARLHARVALGLHNFALHLAREAVERSVAGRLVYAGGDDVLALLPVEGILIALRHLRWFFRGGANGAPSVTPDGWADGESEDGVRQVNGIVSGRKTTLLVPGPMADISASVIFAHHSHPLAHAVEEAHHVLKQVAKRTYNRSAVAFRLMRRSGETTTTGVKWEADGDDVLGLIEVIAEHVRGRRLSASLGHDLKREGETAGALPANVQEKLITYVLSRRAPDGGNSAATARATTVRSLGAGPSTADAVQSLLRTIQVLGGYRAGTTGVVENHWPYNSTDPWSHTADLVSIATFIARPGGV